MKSGVRSLSRAKHTDAVNTSFLIATATADVGSSSLSSVPWRPVVRVSSATRGSIHGHKVTGKIHGVSLTDFSGGRSCVFSWLHDRPIPMRKANPAFCDRSKSHKKLDPFDDRKMVNWLTEEPFLVRSSTISVKFFQTICPVHMCIIAALRCCAVDNPIMVAFQYSLPATASTENL